MLNEASITLCLAILLDKNNFRVKENEALLCMIKIRARSECCHRISDKLWLNFALNELSLTVRANGYKSNENRQANSFYRDCISGNYNKWMFR
jgi:hypothetical protein